MQAIPNLLQSALPTANSTTLSGLFGDEASDASTMLGPQNSTGGFNLALLRVLMQAMGENKSGANTGASSPTNLNLDGMAANPAMLLSALAGGQSGSQVGGIQQMLSGLTAASPTLSQATSAYKEPGKWPFMPVFIPPAATPATAAKDMPVAPPVTFTIAKPQAVQPATAAPATAPIAPNRSPELAPANGTPLEVPRSDPYDPAAPAVGRVSVARPTTAERYQRPAAPGAAATALTAATGSPLAAALASISTLTPAMPAAAAGPLALAAYPRPPLDNGRGMHWVPTTSTKPADVDRLMPELRAMNVRWVTLLNDNSNIGKNDYLVGQLKASGIEPVMRVYTNGMEPIQGDLGAMVRHYKEQGVNYFQLYNEPNTNVENAGREPNVNRYLDAWLPAARTVAENGGYPGIGALSNSQTPGVQDDAKFMDATLREIVKRGAVGVLDRAWISAHNYSANPVTDERGLLRANDYNKLATELLGRALPVIGTEGGIAASANVSEAQQAQQITAAMRHMRDQREPYNFAYSQWVLANQTAGGSDPAWESQALIRQNYTSPLIASLKELT